MASDFMTKLKSRYDAQGIPYTVEGNTIKTSGVPYGSLSSNINQTAGFNAVPSTPVVNTPTTPNTTTTNPMINNVPITNEPYQLADASGINGVYNAQADAARIRYEGGLGTIGSTYDNAAAAVQPAYYDQRRLASASADTQARNMAEFMAARGQSQGGAAVQSQLTNQAGLQGNLAQLGRDEASAMAELEQNRAMAITQANTEFDATLAEIEAQRRAGIIDEIKYQQELQTAQMKYADAMAQQELENNRYDTNYANTIAQQDLANTRYDTEYADSQAQQALENQQYADALALEAQQYQDELAAYQAKQNASTTDTTDTKTIAQWNAYDALTKGATNRYALGGGVVLNWSSPEEKYDMLINRHADEVKALLGDDLYNQLADTLGNEIQGTYDAQTAEQNAQTAQATAEQELFEKQQANVNDVNDTIYKKYIKEDTFGKESIDYPGIVKEVISNEASGEINSVGSDIILAQYGIKFKEVPVNSGNFVAYYIDNDQPVL